MRGIGAVALTCSIIGCSGQGSDFAGTAATWVGTITTEGNVTTVINESGQRTDVCLQVSSPRGTVSRCWPSGESWRITVQFGKLWPIVTACMVLALSPAQYDRADEFLHAVSEGKIVEVRRMLEVDTQLLYAKDGVGRTALHLAAASGRADIAELLIVAGADIDAKPPVDMTPLSFAASFGHLPVARLLLERGADVNAGGLTTPLHQAAARGHSAMVKLLVEEGARLEATDYRNDTPMEKAAYAGDVETVAFLIEQGVFVGSGHNPLFQACYGVADPGSRRQIVTLLMAAGADAKDRTSSRGRTQNTVLHEVVLTGDEELVRIVLAHGAVRGARNAAGKTPLDLAVEKGHSHISELLRRGLRLRPIRRHQPVGPFLLRAVDARRASP